MGLFGGKKGLFKKLLGGASKVVGGVLGALLGGQQKIPEPEPTPPAPVVPADVPEPVVTPPPVMPLPDDDAIAKVRKRAMIAQRARRGRQSTILTDPVTGGGDTLG